MKRIFIFIIVAVCFLPSALAAPTPPDIIAPCAILMEKESGTVIFQKDADIKKPPASVTKVMTLLLTMEALKNGQIKLTDKVKTSTHAASMGGSQVFLGVGESMSVADLIKATSIASANDAAVSLAEYIAGSEESFVSLMNKRAAELGMKNTHFINCTGLDAEGHVTTARDIALMSRELLKYDIIRKHGTVWTDTLRNGTFTLVNTNKLIQSYDGITGLKTGSTGRALYCMSASAQRDGMEIIAVILGADSSKMRFNMASKLLNYGFANYCAVDLLENNLTNIPVVMGQEDYIEPYVNSKKIILEKGDKDKIRREVNIPVNVKAPVEKGQQIGEVRIFSGDKLILKQPVYSSKTVYRKGIRQIFFELLEVLYAR